MKIIDIEKNTSNILLNFDAIMIFNNALNEVCHGLYISEFSTRMGVDLHEVKALLKQVNTIYNEMRKLRDVDS